MEEAFGKNIKIPKFDSEPMKMDVHVNKKMKIRRSFFWSIVIIAILGTYGSWHYYSKYKALTTDPNIEAQKITDKLVETVGGLMELPKDEAPTVATISDKQKLVNQPFFKNAENGDILFAYTNAMQAILYRPSTNKIINVAPLSINQDSVNLQNQDGTSK